MLPDNAPFQLQVANIDGSGIRPLASFDQTPFIHGPTWSPDGKTIMLSWIQLGDKREIHSVVDKIDLANGSVSSFYVSNDEVGRPMWMPGGDFLLATIAASLNGRRQIWSISFPGATIQRFTNDLSDYEPDLAISRDGSVVAAVETSHVSHIWLVPHGQTSQAKQITFQETPDGGVAAGPSGRILVNSDGFNVQLIDMDGDHRTFLIPHVRNVGTFSSCGDKYVVLDSLDNGLTKIWRVEPDGTNPTVLAEGVVFPNCSRDGKWLVFANTDGSKFFRLPVEGGVPQPISVPASVAAPVLRISPDGSRLAFLYTDPGAGSRGQIAILPASGGKPTQLFPLPEDTNSFMWSEDGKAVQFVLKKNGAANIWEQPLDGGPRRQITNFTSGLIFDFAWTRDGKDLLLAKGENNSDVILMSNFQ